LAEDYVQSEHKQKATRMKLIKNWRTLCRTVSPRSAVSITQAVQHPINDILDSPYKPAEHYLTKYDPTNPARNKMCTECNRSTTFVCVKCRSIGLCNPENVRDGRDCFAAFHSKKRKRIN